MRNEFDSIQHFNNINKLLSIYNDKTKGKRKRE